MVKSNATCCVTDMALGAVVAYELACNRAGEYTVVCYHGHQDILIASYCTFETRTLAIRHTQLVQHQSDDARWSTGVYKENPENNLFALIHIAIF